MNILLTGGAGFIGSYLAAALLDAGHRVTVLDDLSTGRREQIPRGCQFLQGDIRDAALVARSMEGQEVLIHHAGFTSVPESFEQPEECISVNVFGTLTLLEAAVTAGVRRVLFASSSAVYADNGDPIKSEAEVPLPGSPYGISKLEGEHLLEWFRIRKGLTYVAFRYFNAYGPRQDPASPYAAVIPVFLDWALRGEPLVLHGGGEQTRDFVFIKDVVAASLVALATDCSGVYNVGTGEATSIRDLAKAILTHTGSSSGTILGPPRLGDAQACTADIRRIVADLGWRPRYTLSEGLLQTIGAVLQPVVGEES